MDTFLSTAKPLGGRAAWRGADLARSGEWVRDWPAGASAAIEQAYRAATAAGLAETAITAEAFPLPALAGFFDDLRGELEDGLGLVRLRGFPRAQYDTAALRSIFWGIGTHIGAAVPQSLGGELIGEVRDETRDNAEIGDEISAHRGTAQTSLPVLSSRARARSNGPLRFHSDSADLIALFCVTNGIAGGVSKLVSTVRLHDEILARRPDLHALLCQDYHRRRPANESSEADPVVFAMPIFGLRDGKLSCQYSRTFVEQAQELPGVPKLSAAQNQALDLLAELAEELCMEVPFEQGDMQFMNNHTIFHGRTAFSDDFETGRERLLLRLWLSPANSRPLLDGFEVFWGATAPGAVRGGAGAGV